MANVNWKNLIKPVAKTSAGAAVSPAERAAKSMDDALAAFKGGNKDIKRPTIKQAGDSVVFSVRYANTALLLDGANKEFAVPANKFEEVYNAIKTSVLAGEFNEQLAPLAENAKSAARQWLSPKPLRNNSVFILKEARLNGGLFLWLLCWWINI